MATSSARPDDLDAYINATIEQQPRVTKAGGELRTALDTFRSSAGRAEFVDDVPEVDLDLRFFARRWDGLADWLNEVSQAFRDAGGGGGGDGDGDGDGNRLTTLEDSDLNASVGMYEPPEAEVILDGDRVIIDTGAGNDDVQVTPLGDGRVLVVVNGEEHILEGDAARDITVRGNAGDDSIDTGGLLGSELLMPGALTLDGGAGNDTIRGRRGNQTIRGDRGDDELYGGHDGGGDDTILGGDGNDTIHGGGGNDTIDAGDGNNTVRGGDGNDTIRSGSGHDTIDGDGGTDTIDAGDGNNTVRGGDGKDTITTGTGSDRVEGGDGHDLLDTGAGNDTILGGDDNDTIDAGDGRDYVDSGRGIDVIDAGSGDDVVYGGNDDDVVEGGEGSDYIDGGAGNDRLSGGADGDIISGGEGDDTLFGNDGNDTVYAGPGDDFSLGGEGDDHMFVEVGDTTYAGDPDDEVTEVTIDMSLVDSIDIDGSDEFHDRVRADLVTLASSPTGRQMLEELRDAGLTIVDDPPQRGAVGSYTGDRIPWWPGGGEVRYDVDVMASSGGRRPPIATLFHELAHAYNDHTDSYADGVYLGPNQTQVPHEVGFDDNDDGVTDRTVVVDTDGDGIVTADELDRDNDGDIDDDDLDLEGDGDVDRHDGWTPNRELQAVGIPIDHDQNPETPDVPASSVENHPDELTENELRSETRWRERTHY